MPTAHHVARGSAATTAQLAHHRNQETAPLLSFSNQRSHRQKVQTQNTQSNHEHDHRGYQSSTSHRRNENNSNDHRDPESFASKITCFRLKLRHFLLSKYAHYIVLTLVALDVSGIFAHFLISLHVCESTCPGTSSRATSSHYDINPLLPIRVYGDNISVLKDVLSALGVISLIFSCLFMLELSLSVYAFGPRYFKSMFHIVDATSIIASFLVDVILQGDVAEVGSLVIVLRFFRVFKIIEEGSAAANEMGEGLSQRIKELELENGELRRRMNARAGTVDPTIADH